MEKDKGFIGVIVLIIIALAALKYFLNWDVFDAAATEQGRGTISYIREVVNFIWSWIKLPVKFIWSQVVWPLIVKIVT